MRRCLALFALLVACGDDDDDAAPDAAVEEDGAADATTERIPPPAPPVPPSPVEHRPCPDGWVEREENGAFLCEPYPEGMLDCPSHTRQLPGDRACRAYGPPCPSGDFADDLPERGDIVYVLAGAVGGDGSRERPFGDLAAAIEAAPSGGVVAIGKGSYVEALVLERDVTLIGACHEGTSLTFAPEMGDFSRLGTMLIASSDITLRNVTLRGEGLAALRVEDGSTCVLEGAEVSSTSAAIYVDDSSFVARDVTIRDSFGMSCARAICELDRVALYDTDGITYSESTFVGEHMTFADFTPAEDRRSTYVGRGSLSDVTFREIGFDVETNAFVVSLRGSLTVDRAVGHARGQALIAGDAADVQVTRSAFRGMSGEYSAVFASASTHLALEDVYVDVAADSALFALEVRGNADARLDRFVLAGNARGGMLFDDLAVVDGRDVTVLGSGSGAMGVTALGRDLSLERARIDRSGQGGVAVGVGHARFRDLTVSSSGLENDAGWGVLAYQGGKVALERVSIEHSQTIGLVAYEEGTEVTGNDVRIVDARPNAMGSQGGGIECDDLASISLTRASIESTHDSAIYAHGGRVALTDASILDVASRACATTTCASLPYGLGVSAYMSGEVTLDRFEVRRAALCGLYVGQGGVVHARHGVVAESGVGACIGVDDYPLETLGEDVRYEDNDQDLSVALRLPVPEPVRPDL